MEKTPSLFQYYKGELRWAASTSGSWIRLLFRDRRAAIQSLREGARSPEFRERAGRWHATTSFSYHRLRFTAPMLVGAATCVYSALNQSPLLSSFGYGILAGIITHLLMRVLPFALLVSVPLAALLLVRAFLPANIPDPPAEGSQVATEFREAAENQQAPLDPPQPGTALTPQPAAPAPAAALLTKENRLSPNDTMLAKFDGSDRPFLIRLLESDGSVVLRDAAELKIVSTWIARVRQAQKDLTTAKVALARLQRLEASVDRVALFELGLLDSDSYKAATTAHQNITEFDRLQAAHRVGEEAARPAMEAGDPSRKADIYADGTSSSDRLDEQGEPVPPQGTMTLISPRGHGYVFLAPAELDRLDAPSLTCDAVREIVRAYVKAAIHPELMQTFQILRDTSPNQQAIFIPLGGRDIDLESIEDEILAGEVRDTTAQRLARFYAAYQNANKEYADYIAHQQPIASLASVVLKAAHESVRAQEAKERAARIAARKEPEGNPYTSSFQDRTPVKTRQQRRAELEALVRAAVPTERRDW